VTRICFLIRQLNLGGAQRQLLELVKGLDRDRFEITIVTFYDGGLYSAQAQNLPGVRCLSLRKGGRWDVFFFLRRLLRTLREINPRILHGYLGAANVLGVLLKPFLRNMRVVWGLRASNMDWRRYDWSEDFIFGLQRLCARWAALIIVNSQAGCSYLQSQGFPERKMLVIPNGIDTAYFRPDADSRDRVRAEWKIAGHAALIGLVARFDPMKDHETFLRAAEKFATARPEARFVVVGAGGPDYQIRLRAQFDELIMTHRVIWAGAREDMPAVYNALDILTSSSAYGEGFSNVIAEAMASGVPCVATDTGDSALILGDEGVLVPPQAPEALAAGWQQILELSPSQRRVLGEQARQRIIENFSSSALVQKTSAALGQLV